MGTISNIDRLVSGRQADSGRRGHRGDTPTDSQAERTEGRTDTNSQPVDSSVSANYLVKSYVDGSKFSRDFVFERRCLFREYFGCDWKPKEDLRFPIEYSRRIIL